MQGDQIVKAILDSHKELAMLLDEGRHPAGMSLRDWFAGMAIEGALNNYAGWTPDVIARISYEIADAMLVKREENKYGDKDSE